MRPIIPSSNLQQFHGDLTSGLWSTQDLMARWGVTLTTLNRTSKRLGFTCLKDGRIVPFSRGKQGRPKAQSPSKSPKGNTKTEAIVDYVKRFGRPTTRQELRRLIDRVAVSSSLARKTIKKYCN